MAIYNTVEEKYQNLISLFESKLTEDLGPIRESFENLSGETRGYQEQINKKFHEYEEEIKSLKLAAQRPTLGSDDQKKELSTKRRAAMNRALKHGWGALSKEDKQLVQHASADPFANAMVARPGQDGDLEQKTMYAADGTTGK